MKGRKKVRGQYGVQEEHWLHSSLEKPEMSRVRDIGEQNNFRLENETGV